jgi:hypothetical protein
MKLLISAIEWHQSQEGWVCTLQGYADTVYKVQLNPQRTLRWQIQSGQSCIGSITDSTSPLSQPFAGAWKPCSENAPVTKGRQCQACAQATDLHPCIICKGSICRADPQRQQTCLTQTSYVYVASFGSKLLKVGVAHHSRILKRWIEQGANVATRLLETNGRDARRYETLIHDTFNVRSQVPTQYKFNAFWNPMIPQETAAIAQLVNTIRKQIPDLPIYQDTIHDLSPLYGLPPFTHRPLLLSVTSQQLITGIILGVKGSLLVLQVQGLPHILNLQQLIGRSIVITEAGATIVQRILDEF